MTWPTITRGMVEELRDMGMLGHDGDYYLIPKDKVTETSVGIHGWDCEHSARRVLIVEDR